MHKKIPLHSLVLLFDENGNSERKFEKYEVLSYDNVRMGLCNDPTRKDISSEIFDEIKNKARNKLLIGERVVIKLRLTGRYFRKKLAYLGQDLGLPVFYILSSNYIRSNNGEENIIQGDGVAEVIDTNREEFDVVHKYPNHPYDLLTEIRKRGYRGITVVPDIHGMYESMQQAIRWSQSRGFFLIFLGDLVDYGPRPIPVVERVYELVTRGEALLVIGNHELKIFRWIHQYKEKNVKLKLNTGNLVTIEQLKRMNLDAFKIFENKFRTLMALGRNHITIGQSLILTHASVHSEMFRNYDMKLEGEAETYALYGELDAKIPFDEKGWPNRIFNWVNHIPENWTAIVGHIIRSTVMPVKEKNNLGGLSVFLDTGCGKGGVLTSADIPFNGDSLNIQYFNRH